MQAMLRAFHPFAVPADADKIVLSGEESFHLAKVLRGTEGEAVSAFDGRGNVWEGKIVGGTAKALEISIAARRTVAAPQCRISLAQALPKGSLMDDIVRQATEIGAARIFPLLSSRCEVRLDDARAEKKSERWNAIATESCKQCGNALLPEIFPVMKFRDFCEKFAPATMRNTLGIVASLEAGTRNCGDIAADADPTTSEILWLVGPEGDFSPEEYSLARAAGFVPARLGQNILRSVTAAIYTLAVADQMRQNLQQRNAIISKK